MLGKMARSALRPPFGLPEVPVNRLHHSCTTRPPSEEAGKAVLFTPVRESSGDSLDSHLCQLTSPS